MSNIIIKAKRFLAITIAISTFAWSFGLTGVNLAVAAEPGSLIKMFCSAGGCAPEQTAVYYLGVDGFRYVFPNSKIFASWFHNASGGADFSGVNEISKAEMESYPIKLGSESHVTYRPGSRLVKFTTKPDTYAVDQHGTLRHIISEQVAKDIWGANWAKSVDDLPDLFGAGYVEGDAINSSADYSPAAVMAASPDIDTDKSLPREGDGGGAGTGGTLTVSLASDTPASTIVVKNTARVAFTKVNLTASPSGSVTIDSWVVRRGGIGQDSAFSGVDILVGANMTPLNDLAKTFNSNHTANFTEDVTIAAGMTETVYLAGTMGALTSNSGEAPTLDLLSVTLKGGGNVVGTLPVVGNPMTLNNTITIGTATVQRGAYTNASTTLEVGKKDYTFFSFQVQAGSEEEIQFSQVRVYQAGSVSMRDDLDKLRLLQDGTEIATGVVDGLYVDFNFSPITIPKGQIKQFQVKADIIGGSARTVKMAIYRTTDLLVKGLVHGFNITPTYSGTGAGTTSNVLTDNEFTISQGTLRLGRSSTVGATNIAVGPDQVLGAFEFEVKGEPVIITALTLTMASTTSGTIIEDALQSVRLVDANNVTLAGPTDVTNDTLQVRYSSSFTMPVGTSHVKVVGNLAVNGGWTSDDTIYASLQTPASKITARGEETNLTITPTPSSNVLTATQTIKAASLKVIKNGTPTNKTVITNDVNILAGSWNFDATNSGEDIRITSIAVKASSTTHIDKLTFKDGSTILDPINEITTASTFGAPVTTTFAFSNPVIIPKGTSRDLNLYVDIGSGSAAGEVSAFGITSNAAVSGYGVTTGNSASVTTTANDGALLTVAAGGTLTINVDASAKPSRIVLSGTLSEQLADIRLKATNEAIKVTKLFVYLADGGLTGTGAGDVDDVDRFWLKREGVVIGNTDGYPLSATRTQVNLDTAALIVPEGSTGISLSIIGSLSEIGTNDAGLNNADIKLGLGGADNITATGNSSNQSATLTYTDSTGSAVILHKGAPQVVIVPPTNILAATAVLHTAKITALGDDIGIYRTSYWMTTTASLFVTNVFSRLTSCTGSCGGVTNNAQLSDTNTTADYRNADAVFSLEVSNSQTHAKRYLNIAEGSTAQIDVVASVQNMTTNTDSVSTSLLGDLASSTDSTTGNAAAEFTSQNNGNFIWSDLQSDDSQAASSLTSNQWWNGYYVDGIGATVSTSVMTVSD